MLEDADCRDSESVCTSAMGAGPDEEPGEAGDWTSEIMSMLKKEGEKNTKAFVGPETRSKAHDQKAERRRLRWPTLVPSRQRLS